MKEGIKNEKTHNLEVNQIAGQKLLFSCAVYAMVTRAYS